MVIGARLWVGLQKDSNCKKGKIAPVAKNKVDEKDKATNNQPADAQTDGRERGSWVLHVQEFDLLI